jgi:hypothetical protein
VLQGTNSGNQMGKIFSVVNEELKLDVIQPPETPSQVRTVRERMMTEKGRFLKIARMNMKIAEAPVMQCSGCIRTIRKLYTREYTLPAVTA